MLCLEDCLDFCDLSAEESRPSPNMNTFPPSLPPRWAANCSRPTMALPACTS